MTRRAWGISLVVALSALAFVALALVWTAPADVAYRVLRSRLGGWQAQGLSGSLWEGRAEQVTLHGVPLGTLQWNVSRPAFFAGTTRGHASLQDIGIALDLDFERSGRKATLHNVNLALPAQWIAPALALPGLSPLGIIEAKLAEVELTDGYLTRVVGSVEWRGVGVSGAAEGAIGDIVGQFEQAPEGGVLLVLRDRDAQLGVEGRVMFEGPQFDLEIKLVPRQQSLSIFNVLRLIGQRTPDGGTLLRVRGQMQPLF